MPIIQTPDGPVNFPDSMKDSDIESVLQKQYAPKVAGAGPLGVPSPAAHPSVNMQSPSLWQQYKNNFNEGTQGAKPGDGLIKGALENFGAGGGDVVRAVAHPLRTLGSIAAQTDPGILALGSLGVGPAKDQAKAVANGPIPSIPRIAGQVGTGMILGKVGADVGGAAMDAVPKVGSAIRTAAIGNPDVPLTRGLGITARTKTGLSALQASGEAAPTDVSLEDAQGARPYGQGAKNLQDLQGKLSSARTEINAPLNASLDAIGDRVVQGPDGPTTISELEAERSQLSAQLRGLQQKDPLAIQTALQKGQGQAELQARYDAVKDAMTPHLDSTGIDSRLIRQQDAQVAATNARVAGRTTLPEETKPYGFARLGDLAKFGNGSGIDLLAPVKAVGSIGKDIAAGRYWSERPTDVNIREGFRLAGPKPNLGWPQPNLTAAKPLGLPAPPIMLGDGDPFVHPLDQVPIPQFSKPLGLPARTPSLGLPISSYSDLFPDQIPNGTRIRR